MANTRTYFRALRLWAPQNLKLLSPEDRYHLDTLIDSLSPNSSLNLEPYGFFSLSHGGFAGTLAVVATYIVVLTQFRLT